jgi:hypothetical protein
MERPFNPTKRTSKQTCRQLSDAAALGDVKAVKFLRDSLISCSTGGDSALYDAIHDVFYISDNGFAACLTKKLPNR